MYKIIGIDAKEYGPVSAERIRQWLDEGRVDNQTKVQAEGELDWKRLADLPEFVSRPRPKQPWNCPKCNERLEPQFDSCWRCGTARTLDAPPAAAPVPTAPSSTEKSSRVAFEMFRGTFESWESLFKKAADFATEIGRDRLIGISHSEDDDDGVVTVWYWSKDPGAPADLALLRDKQDSVG
jgi:GYF domain 2